MANPIPITTRLLLNLQMRTYKKTLITLFVLEIVMTFFISMNEIQENEGVNDKYSAYARFGEDYSSLANNTTSAVASRNHAFFSQAIKLSNIPINIIGIILVSIESLYFTLLYIPVRYFFLYCLIRNALFSPIFSCPLTIDLLLVVILHMFYVKLYDDKYFWGRHRGSDDRDEFVLEGDDEDGASGIFSIDNHIHAHQLNAPPPSYMEVTNNPFKYPTLVIELPESPNSRPRRERVNTLDPIQEEDQQEQQQQSHQETRT